VSSSPNIKIYVCHHKTSPYIKNECIVPIQVGRKLSKNSLDYCIGDDTGINISEKNKSWCELTAIYWAWKNDDADYYGLMHYRRYLSFKSHHDYTVINKLDEDIVIEHKLDPESIKNICAEQDIITGPVWNVHPVGLPWKIMSNYEQYSLDHYKKDLDIVIEIVKEKYPKYYLALLESLYSTSCFFANVAIMKREYFHEYCTFLFGVLEEAELKIDISEYDSYQSRIWGFIAERMINAYVLYARRAYENIRVSTAGLMYLAESPIINNQEVLNLINHKKIENKILLNEDIHICMSFDDRYYAHASAAIESILDNAHPKQKIIFNLLCDENLTETKRNLLLNGLKPNIKINFIEINPSLFSSLPLNRSYISLNTYYRLVIHKVLPDVHKVIYMDSDMICVDDIAKLWTENLDGKCIGASLDEGGVLQSRRLLLGADNNYFNAGMIVFDLNVIREKYDDVFNEYMINFYINNREISLQDQDILNITFKDETKILPLKWNVNSRMFTANDLERKYNIQQEAETLQDIGILHFTDRRKPWTLTCVHPLRDLYWGYRKRNPHAPMSKQDKFIERYAGKITYRISGGFILVKVFGLNMKLNKSLVAKVLRALKINF
jgi:lipopolysaccharide biosynthesis glycosyltransferase